MLQKMLQEKNMTIYQCAKLTGIPYTTLSEVVRGKTSIEKCSAEVVYKLAKILNVTVEDLLCNAVQARMDFEIFKSNVCHLVKDLGEIDFILEIIKKDDIFKYWNKQWYSEAFYLLAMLDYLSRINDIPLCTKYSEIRAHSLKKPLYPRDVLLAAKLQTSHDIKAQCRKTAIPEFLRYNIIESEIENVY